MYISNIPKYYRVFFFIFLILYLLVLIVAIPNTNIVIDRESYFISFTNISERVAITDFSSPSIIFKEPLYLIVTYILAIFFSVESIALIFIGVSAFLSLTSIFKARPELLPIIIIVFLLPQFMGKFIIHIRQGAAIAIFLTSYYYFNRSLLTSSFISGLMHVSFFIAIPLLIAAKLTSNRALLSLIMSIIIFLAATLFFYDGRISEIVSYLNLRQINSYSFTSENVSGLGFLFWFYMYTLLFLKKKPSEISIFSMNIIAFYCASYFWVNFISRFIESFYPIIFMEIKSINNTLLYLSLLFYFAVSWLPRLDQQLLGFS